MFWLIISDNVKAVEYFKNRNVTLESVAHTNDFEDGSGIDLSKSPEMLTLLLSMKPTEQMLNYGTLNGDFSLKMLQEVIAAGGDPKARKYDGWSSIHVHATGYGAANLNELYEILELLVDKGASPNARNQRGEAPLHYSAINGGSKQVLSKLVSLGADIEARSPDGSTPLFYAYFRRGLESYAEHGHADRHPLNSMISLGADINAQANDGKTVLHYAAKEADEMSIELLLENGARGDITDDDGMLPIDYAKMSDSSSFKSSAAFWSLHDAQFK